MKKTIGFVLAVLLLFNANIASAKKYYFHEDHLGGASIMTDEDGEIVVEYQYYPYGGTYLESISDEDFGNSYKYTGQEEDSEIGLYYYGSRYYNPEVTKFMSRDPAVYDERFLEMLRDPQSFNTYAYVRNNPIKYIDPSGERPVSYQFWKGVAGTLDAIGYNLASDMISYSIPNPYTEFLGGFRSPIVFSEDDLLGSSIAGSQGYQDILGQIGSNIQSGLSSGEGSYNFSTHSEDLELSMVIGKISYRYTVMGINDDGSYNIEINFNDYYNFDEMRAVGSVLDFANNIGYIEQGSGDLIPYYVFGALDETMPIRDPSDDENH